MLSIRKGNLYIRNLTLGEEERESLKRILPSLGLQGESFSSPPVPIQGGRERSKEELLREGKYPQGVRRNLPDYLMGDLIEEDFLSHSQPAKGREKGNSYDKILSFLSPIQKERLEKELKRKEAEKC